MLHCGLRQVFLDVWHTQCHKENSILVQFTWKGNIILSCWLIALHSYQVRVWFCLLFTYTQTGSQVHTHTHTALFMELICWSRMEAQVVSNRAWRSLRARNGHAWQLWAHTCSAFPASSYPPYFLYFLVLFFSFNPFAPSSWLPFPPLLYLNAVKQLLKEEDKRLRIERETEGETEGGLILTMHLKMKGGEEEERQQLALEWYMRLLQLKVRLTCLCICTHSCIPDLQPLIYRRRNSYSGPFLSYLDYQPTAVMNSDHKPV